MNEINEENSCWIDDEYMEWLINTINNEEYNDTNSEEIEESKKIIF